MLEKEIYLGNYFQALLSDLSHQESLRDVILPKRPLYQLWLPED